MEIYIIGAGGHGEVVLDIIRAEGRYGVRGFLDSDPDKHGRAVDGVRVLGPPAIADGPFVAAVGDNETRKDLTARLTGRGLEPVTVVHPTAHVASTARIGCGTVVCAGAILCAHTEVGAGGIVNTGTIVDHHCTIGPFVHVAPRVVLTGRITVEEGTMIGAGAVLLPRLTVGAWSIVGAGAVVTTAVPPRTTVVGVPAHPVVRPKGG